MNRDLPWEYKVWLQRFHEDSEEINEKIREFHEDNKELNAMEQAKRAEIR